MKKIYLLWTWGLFFLFPSVQAHRLRHAQKSRHASDKLSKMARTRQKAQSTAYSLHSHLLKHYRRSTRPVLHPHTPITVQSFTALYQIISLDQSKNTITVAGSMELYWEDQYLTWEPSDFQGTEKIHLSSNMIWTPEISLYYSHGNSNQNVVLRTNNDVQVNYTGNVRYYMPFTTESMCPVDVKTFPFDVQSCKLFFGSWGHSNESISFKTWLDSEKIDLRDFYDNQEWQLVESRTRIKEVIWTYNYVPPSSYSVLELEIVAKRHSFYYVFTLVIPSTVITVVAVVGFHIPNTSSKLRDSKVQLGLLTLMSMSVILLTVVQDMPKFSYERNSPQQGGKRGSFSGVPLIGLYYFSLLLTIGLSTITTSLFVVLERRRKEQKAIPFLFRWMARDWDCCDLGRCPSKSSVVQVSSLPSNGGPHSDQTPNFEKELNAVRNHLQRTEGAGVFSTVALALLPSAFEHLSRSLLSIQRDVQSIRGEITGWIPLEKFDSNWGKVIRNLELFSICFYLSILTLSLALFFWHDIWYQ